jgi:hypothetical protein
MTYKFRATTLAGCFAVSVAAAGASASPIDLTYNGPSTGDAKTVKITNAPVTAAANHVYAHGFDMAATDPDTGASLSEFLAWCLDIGSFLGGEGQAKPYTLTGNPFSNSYGLDGAQRARVQAVFDANFATLDAGVGTEAAGFQVALWDALYDYDWDAGGGAFAVSADETVPGLANDYLTAAQGHGGDRQFDMSFWESTPGAGGSTHQNLVSVAPVPLPAAAVLLLGGLGGLAALRRRKPAA